MAAHDEDVGEGRHRRRRQGDGCEECCPHLADVTLGHQLVDGEGHRRAQHQSGSQRDVGTPCREVRGEDGSKAEVGYEGGDQARPRQPHTEEGRADENQEDRIGEERQPLQLRRHIEQTAKIEDHGEVIADEADADGAQHGTTARHGPALCPAPRHLDRPHHHEDGQREDHAPGEDQQRVVALHVGELDEDGLGGKQCRARSDEQVTDDEGAAVHPRSLYRADLPVSQGDCSSGMRS